MGLVKKIAVYAASAYATSVAMRYTYLYLTATAKDYVWNTTTGDDRDTTPELSEALFLTASQTPEYKAYLQFLVRYGKTYASAEEHDSRF